MSTTIAIVTGTADRRGPSTDHGATFPVIPGKMDTADMIVAGDTPVFDTMLGLADGAVSAPFADDEFRSDPAWSRITRNWVAGTVANIGQSTTDRIAVIDLDNTDGLAVLHIINWVNHIDGATLPE